MAKYRDKKQHREAHPKIIVWAHTERAEIEYFQDFKNYLETPLLIAKKKKLWTPQQLINYVVIWKQNNINQKDNDQVWCVFDIDDFYKIDQKGFLNAVVHAKNNNVKIAYINECFELWVLLHLEKISAQIKRGKDIEKKINTVFKKNGLKKFKKNQKVFNVLLPFQKQAIKNAKFLSVTRYNNINWDNVLSSKGNPSTSIHFLVEEILTLFDKNKN